ncbi:MAG: hypothetical protein JXB24_05250 [Bacteroidales bacterium]|nr:hypothetical protein [Bacteroidales bacterium]
MTVDVLKQHRKLLINILKIPLNKIRQEGNYKELLDANENVLIKIGFTRPFGFDSRI